MAKCEDRGDEVARFMRSTIKLQNKRRVKYNGFLIIA